MKSDRKGLPSVSIVNFESRKPPHLLLYIYRRANSPKKRQKLPVSSELWLLKDLAPPPEGVAAAVSLFVSSTNSIQIVRRQCCLVVLSEAGHNTV